MTLAAPQLVLVLQPAAGLFYVFAGPGICLLVLVVGGVWGFRLGGQGRGGSGGGSGRPPRRQPTPPGGRHLPADFAAWEDQLKAADGRAGPGGQESATPRQTVPSK